MNRPLRTAELPEPKRDRPVALPALYVSDAEFCVMIGDEKCARDFLHMVDKNPHSGFPQKNALFGGRRELQGIIDYFARLNGRKVAPATVTRIREPRNDR